MKPHLPKKLFALITAIITFTQASGTTFDNAALALEDFSEASILAANQAGWTFDNVYGDEDGMYTSTINQGVIHSNHAWTTTSDDSLSRILWSAIIQVDGKSLLNAGTSGTIIANDNYSNPRGMEGVGFSDGKLTGAWQNDAYPTLTLYNKVLARSLDGNGTITIGIAYLGDEGSTIYIVDGQKHVYSANAPRLRSNANNQTLAMRMALSNIEGVGYKSLYLFGDSVTDEDMAAMLQNMVEEVAPQDYVWAGSGTSAVWDTTTQNWTKGGSPATYISDYATTAIFDATASAKEANVNSDIRAGYVMVSDNYTFTVESGSSLTLDALTVADGMTATVAGTGSITLLNSLSGALVIEAGAMVNMPTTVTLDATNLLPVSGKGTLGVTTLRVAGGEHVISSDLVVTGGGDGTGYVNHALGLAVNNAAATVTLAGDTNITGAVYNQVGTVNIGNGTDAVRVETNRVEFGDTAGIDESILNVNKNAILHVKAGDVANAYASTGLILGQWNGVSTANIAGKLYADQATAYVGDGTVIFNIEDGGLMAVKGFSQNQHKDSRTQTINLNLKDGGKLVLGATGITSQKPINIDFASGEVGISVDNVTIAKNIVLSGTTTFDTAKYEWQGEDDELELVKGSEGGTLTISGNISGAGSIVKNGEGSLVLSGGGNVLTHTITVNAGSLTLNGSYEISIIPLDGTTSYAGGQHVGNGYATTTGTITVYEGMGFVDDSRAVFTYNGLTVIVEGGVCTFHGEQDNTTYYINSSTDSYNWIDSNKPGSLIGGIVVKEGATLQADKDMSMAALAAFSKGTVHIDEGVVVSSDGGSRHVALTGKGTYALQGGVQTLGSVDASGFNGWMRLSGNITDIDLDGNLQDTNVELSGVSGYFKNVNADSQAVFNGNLRLTDVDASTPAITVTDGFSRDRAYLVFSGAVSGNGKWELNCVATQHYVFSGDISAWDGTFHVTRSGASHGGTSINFCGDATTVNAVITRNGGTLKLFVDTNVTFNAAVNNVTSLTVEEGKTATFTNDASTGSLTGSGNVIANNLSLTGTTIATSQGWDVDYFSGTLITHGVLEISGSAEFRNCLDAHNGVTLANDASLINSGDMTLDGTITFGQNAIQNNGSGTITFGDNIHFDLTNMTAVNNVYTLFSGTGKVIDLSGFDESYITVAGGTEGYDWVFGKNGKILFALSPELTWSGAASRLWNTTDANWTNAGGSGTFSNAVPVVFGDVGSGNVILEGNLAPASVLVNNSTNHDYTFTGEGKLTGGMQLTKEGDGTLTIGTANDYTGGTIINGGVVVVDNATALGSGNVALNGVELDIATDATISGQITVEGDNFLIVDDGCTLSLGNRIANNYYLEMWGTYDISNLSAEVLESEFVGGAVKGNGFVSNELRVQVVDNGFGAYAEMGYAYFLYNGIEGEAGVDGEVMVTEVDGSVFYVNSGTDKVSKAFKDYSPASILMKNGTGLDLDKASADIPNIELSADALTAALNVKQNSTIESISGGEESSILTINSTTDKTLTLVDASGYNGSMELSGGAVTAGSANAFGTGDIALSGAALDLGGFEFANSVNVTGEATIGHGTLTGAISLTNAALQVGSDLTVQGSLTTNGTSSIGVAQDATLTLMQTITNEGSALSLSGTFDVSALSTVEREHTYTGGATTGNGFYTGNLGIQVVDNTQGGSSDLTNGTFLYNGEEWAAGDEGYAVKSTVDYSKFYVNSGTEGVLQAYGDHTPDTIVLKRATGLNLDVADIEIPNIELAANEDTAYLNVMQDTTIDSITGGDGSFILNVYGTDDKTLTLMDASGYVGSMVFDGGTVAVGSATAFGGVKIWVSDTTLDLGGFEIANAMNLSGDTTIGNGTLTGSLSAYNTTLHVGSDATVDGTLTTDGTSSIEVSQDEVLTLGRVIQNTGVLALSGTFDISALSSTEREAEYIGGTTEGNGFLSQSRDIEVVNNTQGGTSDLTNGTFIYNGETADSVSGGTASLTSVDYSRFFVFHGEESLGAALDTASAAGAEVGGVTMSAGTTLHVDRDMSADFVSVASGSAMLDIKGGSTVTEGATPHSEYILTSSGVYALAAGNTALAPTLDSEGWTGTVALKDIEMNNPDFLDLDNYGHEGSTMRLDGVKTNFGANGNTFATTLELTGAGLEITACQGNRSYEFAGGVKGDGNFIYNLSTPASNQTYIFSGDVSDWTGAYVSAANKTSTLQFQDDATVMGADIIREQGVVNVVVGDGSEEHTTVFKGDIQASNLTVQENAKAVIEGNAVIEKTATRTGILSLQGTLEVAEGGSLALSQDAAVQVGNAFTVTGKGDTTPALSGDLEITEGGFYGIGDKAARIDHSVIKLEEGASVVFDNVILGASSQLKDDPATVVVNNMVIEGILGENVQEGEPMTIKSGSVLHLTGDPGQTVVIEEDSFACTFDITNVQDVQLSGNCLTIDLSSMYPKFKDMGESFDWLGIALGSGDHAPTIDENLEVVVQTLPNQRARGYVGWGGTFVTIPDHGENVGPVIYFHMYEVPEPTTSTLSLLALAALAARRRRSR